VSCRPEIRFRILVFLLDPISEQTPDARGWFNRFQGGTLYWSAGVPAHEVHGAILERYLLLGGADSYLGHPISDELPEGNARFNRFERGWIYWTPCYVAADTSHRVQGGRAYTGLVVALSARRGGN
jgi:uncharacterized protein with LGFP repeats